MNKFEQSFFLYLYDDDLISLWSMCALHKCYYFGRASTALEKKKVCEPSECVSVHVRCEREREKAKVRKSGLFSASQQGQDQEVPLMLHASISTYAR